MMRAAYTSGRSHTKGTGYAPPFSKLSDKYFKNRDTPMTAVTLAPSRRELCKRLMGMVKEMEEHLGEMQKVVDVEGSAFCAAKDILGQLLSGEKSIYGSLVEVAIPLRKLLSKCLDGNLQQAFDFFANLYDELSVTRLNYKVACIPFEREVQPVLYYAMGKGVYAYETYDADVPDDFFTTNREAVLLMSCIRTAHPRLFVENCVPMVRLAASDGERTKSVEDVKKLFESIGAAFGTREDVSDKIAVSCEDRVAILGWLRELEVLDPQYDTRVLMEVCSGDGYLRMFERNSGGTFVSNSAYALQVDPLTGRGVNSSCDFKGEIESDFCACWRCCQGRGITFQDRVDVGAKVFRVVRFLV